MVLYKKMGGLILEDSSIIAEKFDIKISDLTVREKESMVCMYFSRLPKTDPDYKLRKEYFTKLFEKYGRKITTLKNDKDAFDACFVSNMRIGWHDKPLEKRNKHLSDVFNKYGSIPIEE